MSSSSPPVCYFGTTLSPKKIKKIHYEDGFFLTKLALNFYFVICSVGIDIQIILEY